MRVGIDATGWLNRRGYGRFARNAVGRLVERDGETHYVLVIDEESAREAELPAGVERVAVKLGAPPGEAAAAGSSRSPVDLLRLTRAVRKLGLDAFVFPALQTYYPVVGTPTVVGLHDTITDDLPDLVAASRKERTFLRIKQSVAVRRSAVLFTVSKAARDAVSGGLGIAPERLAVVPEAPDPVFSPREGDARAAGLAATGLAPGDPFLLYAGGISPHKDVETLVDAYALLRQEIPAAPPL